MIQKDALGAYARGRKDDINHPKLDGKAKAQFGKVLLGLRVSLSAVFVLTLVLTFIFTLTSDFSPKLYGAFSIILWLIGLGVICAFGNKLSSFQSLFFNLFNLFHFGLFISALFGFSDDVNSYLYATDALYNASVSDHSIRIAFLMAAASGFLFCCACSIHGLTLKKKDFYSLLFRKVKFSSRCLLVAGLFTAAICVIPYLVELSTKLAVLARSGYVAVYHLELPGFVSLLASLFPLAYLMVLVYLRKKAKPFVFNACFVGFIVLQIIQMLSGTRFAQTIYIIVAVYVYFLGVSPEKRLLYIGLLVLFGLVGVIGLSYISFARSSPSGISFSGFIYFLLGNGLTTLISKILIEYGWTIRSVYLVVEFFPTYHDYFFGLTYLADLTAIYPNVGGLLGNIVHYYSFVNFLPAFSRGSLGGSILAEAYSNFGVFAPFLFTLVGFVLPIGDKVFIDSYKNNNLAVSFLTLLVVYYSIAWVRDYFVSFVFPAFFVVVVLLLSKLVLKILKKEKNDIFVFYDVIKL